MGEQEGIRWVADSAGTGSSAGTGRGRSSRPQRIASWMGDGCEQKHGQDVLLQHFDERVDIYATDKSSASTISVVHYGGCTRTSAHYSPASDGRKGHVVT